MIKLHEWMELEHNQDRFEKKAFDENRFGYIFCIKNPYAWLVSYRRGLEKGSVLPNHYRKHDEENLLRDEMLDGEGEDTIKFTAFEKFEEKSFLVRLVRKYDFLYHQWLEFARENDIPFEIVRHEDLIHDFREPLERIKNTFNLLTRHNELTNTEKKAGTSGDVTEDKFDPSKYLNHEFMDQLTDLQMEVINEEIDWTFFEKEFDYYINNPIY